MVADLDPLEQLASLKVFRFMPEDYAARNNCVTQVPYSGSLLTAVDDWNEILDPPEGVGVVRSARNWIGRLATTCLSAQLGHQVLLFRRELCWECTLAAWSIIEDGKKGREYSFTELMKMPPNKVLILMAGMVIVC